MIHWEYPSMLEIVSCCKEINGIYSDCYFTGIEGFHKTGEEAIPFFSQGHCFYYAIILHKLFPKSYIAVEGNQDGFSFHIVTFIMDCDSQMYHAYDVTSPLRGFIENANYNYRVLDEGEIPWGTFLIPDEGVLHDKSMQMCEEIVSKVRENHSFVRRN